MVLVWLMLEMPLMGLPCVGVLLRVGGHEAINIGPDLQFGGIECGGHDGGGVVAGATSQVGGGERVAVAGNAVGGNHQRRVSQVFHALAQQPIGECDVENLLAALAFCAHEINRVVDDLCIGRTHDNNHFAVAFACYHLSDNLPDFRRSDGCLAELQYLHCPWIFPLFELKLSILIIETAKLLKIGLRTKRKGEKRYDLQIFLYGQYVQRFCSSVGVKGFSGLRISLRSPCRCSPKVGWQALMSLIFWWLTTSVGS